MCPILAMIRVERDPCESDLKCLFAVLAAALILTAATPSGATPSFMGLGDLPGGDFDSRALAVSADGSVVVEQSESGATTPAAGLPVGFDITPILGHRARTQPVFPMLRGAGSS